MKHPYAIAALLLLLLAAAAATYFRWLPPTASTLPVPVPQLRTGTTQVNRGWQPVTLPPVTVADTSAAAADSSTLLLPLTDSLITGTVTITTWPKADSIRLEAAAAVLTLQQTRVDTLIATAPVTAPAAPSWFWEGAALGALLIIILTLLTGKGS